MNCIDKNCKKRGLNGGDDISDFYYCHEVGIEVGRGNEECLLDKYDREARERRLAEAEEDDSPCTTCVSRDNCDGWEAQHCCALCMHLNGDNPDCSGCDPMDI